MADSQLTPTMHHFEWVTIIYAASRTRRELWAALATHKARGAARGASTLKLLLACASMEEANAMPNRIAVREPAG